MASLTRNKWYKYKLLKNYKPLASNVPRTHLMSQHTFWAMLEHYGHVILKPVWGSGGRGVIQVSAIGDKRYALHFENIRTTLHSKSDTYRYIHQKIGSTPYMVQYRLDRPTIKDRPFDMRVIIQRRRNSSSWVVTGKIIKVAGKGYIVSNNTRSKGALLHFRDGIQRSSIKHISARLLETKIHQIALLSAKRLSKYYPGHRIYGLDMGPDRLGRIWIIEANLYPAMSHVRKLKDKTMYRRITSYKRR